jgi:hypothetical protein
VLAPAKVHACRELWNQDPPGAKAKFTVNTVDYEIVVFLGRIFDMRIQPAPNQFEAWMTFSSLVLAKMGHVSSPGDDGEEKKLVFFQQIGHRNTVLAKKFRSFFRLRNTVLNGEFKALLRDMYASAGTPLTEAQVDTAFELYRYMRSLVLRNRTLSGYSSLVAAPAAAETGN